MLEHYPFVRDDILPSFWANAIQRLLSNYVSPNFRLTQQDATHVQVVAGADADAAVIVIGGLWRWNEATASRAHPGGAAATFDVFVTAKANAIVNVPAPFTDNTDYSFALAIVAHGATPVIVPGTVDIYRKIGELTWSGAAITAVTQLAGTEVTQAELDAETAARIAGVNAEAAARAASDAGLQPHDLTLDALAAIVTAADKLIYATGVDAFATTTLSAFVRTLLDDADPATARATLGAVIGTDVEAHDADLTAFAGLVSAADKLAYSTGPQAWALTTLTAAARTILARVNGITNADVDPAAALAYAKLALADAVKFSDIAKDANGLAAGCFRAYNNTGNAFASGSLVAMPTEDYDVSNWFDPATGRYTPQVRGIYEYKAQLSLLAIGAAAAPQWEQMAIARNGAIHSWGGVFWDHGTGGSPTVVAQVIMNGTTDYVQPYLAHNHGSAVGLIAGGNSMNYFEGHLIGRVS